MLWDRRKGRVKGNIMELSGADWDRGHVLDWACNVFEEIQDETIENATIENIVSARLRRCNVVPLMFF